MGRARPDLIRVYWPNPPDPRRGVTLERRFRGRTYERRVRPQDYVTQIEAAAILGTTLMTVNRYVRAKRLPAVKRAGISMIQLRALLRFYRDRQAAREAW